MSSAIVDGNLQLENFFFCKYVKNAYEYITYVHNCIL